MTKMMTELEIKRWAALLLMAGMVAAVQAKVDLVTLPTRDAVQLTIYNSADLTLVRDQRLLTLQKGLNRLQFSWANTLIDPTSLELLPKAQADKITVQDLDYPPRSQNLGVWTIRSEVSGQVPVEITYLTSGLSWRAFYMGLLSPDEKEMRLEGHVMVNNQSGEDYEGAQTRVVVGVVNLVDQIAALARQPYPYGAPDSGVIVDSLGVRDRKDGDKRQLKETMMALDGGAVASFGGEENRPKEITKEGLSGYFLYSIEGQETIPNGWGKRLPSFQQAGIPVKNLYKYEEEKYGSSVMRFLSFKNDKKHKLGDTPIPGGLMRVFRNVSADGRLSYEGESEFQYIPVDQEVELNLGEAGNVLVEPKVMDVKTDAYQFDANGEITGWEETREVKVEVKNTREVPVKVEIQRNFPTAYWNLERRGDGGTYEKVDQDTVKFTLSLEPLSKKEFFYTLTTRHGTRTE